MATYRSAGETEWSNNYYYNDTLYSDTEFKADYISKTLFEGSGSNEDPYLISSAEDLANFAYAINRYAEQYAAPSVHYLLTEDIDLSSICGEGIGNWQPIYEFCGQLDGGGHTISNLYISSYFDYDDPNSIYDAGLFYAAEEGGSVKNLTVSGYLSTDGRMNGIAAYNDGTIENCVDLTVRVPYGHTTDENGWMSFLKYQNANSVDVKAFYNENWIQTSFNNAYNTKTSGLENAEISVTPSIINGGAYVKVTYTVKNIGETAITGGKLGVESDIQIGDNDNAAIEVIFDSEGNAIGFRMVDDHEEVDGYSCISRLAQLNLYFAGTVGVTDADTHWLGFYSYRDKNAFNNISASTTHGYDSKYTQDENGNYIKLSNTDSGIAFSWQNIELAVGESKQFSWVINVGTEADPPVWGEPNINLTVSADATQENLKVNVAAKVKDEAGLTDKLYYSVNGADGVLLGGVVADGQTEKSITGTIDASNWENGTYTFDFWVVNSKGAMSEKVHRIITITDGAVTGDVTVIPAETEHNWSEDWTYDTEHHWHDCLNLNCTIADNKDKNGYGAHDFDNSCDSTCDTCGFTRTITHTFNQKVMTSAYQVSPTTCTEKGVYYFSCSCGEAGTTTFAGDTLPHSYSYTASLDTITEICTGDCGHSATAKVIAPTADLTYNGQGKAAEVKYSENWKGGELAISYTPDNVNVGKVTASITKDNAKAQAQFTIEAKTSDLTADLSATEFTYNANEQKPAVTVKDGEKVLTQNTDYTLEWSEDCTNVGEKTVTVKFKGNYSGEIAKDFKINKATPEVTAPKPNDLTFNGSMLALAEAASTTGGTIQYALSTDCENEPADNWSADIPKASNAGTYYVWYKVVGNDNYNGVAPVCIKVTIKKAQIAKPTKDTTVYTYNGSEQTYQVAANNAYTVSGNVQTNADSYTVTVAPKDKNNYEWADGTTADVTLPFEIGKKEIGIQWSNTEFTYDGSAKKPTATATGVVGNDSITLTVTGEQTNASDTAYTATVTEITGSGAANYKLPTYVSTTFTIGKANQNAPTVSKTDETISNKKDGTISGLDTTMEYRKDGESTYNAITGTVIESLAAGKYYVRYKGDDNHNPSPETEIIIAAGRKLKVILPTDQTGYTITADRMEYDWNSTVTVTLDVMKGYTVTDNFKVIYGGVDRGWYKEQRKDSVISVKDDLVITVEGIADITPPEAEISVKDNKWTSFLKTITFGLFFKDTQTVTITATDAEGSGVNKIYYYISETALTEEEVKALAADKWTEYDASNKPSINPDKKCIVYVKATDNAGNIKYISSNGLVFDGTKPVISGIENGKTYYGDMEITVTDALAGVKEIKVDGNTVTLNEGKYTITADNAEHTVTVTDNAGNVTEWKITVYKTYTVTYKIDGETVSTETVEHGKDATAPAIPEKEGYTAAWDKDGKAITADTEITAEYTLKEYTVTFMDENGVYQTIKVKHGEKVAMPEAPKKDGYTARWEKVLDTATGDITVKAVYTENSTAAPGTPAPDSPQTGDTTNLWLWVALLFVSGGCLFGTVIYKKKQEAEEI